MATGQHVLWGTPHSLYTGKARSYLIKKQIPFAERIPGDPHRPRHCPRGKCPGPGLTDREPPFIFEECP